MTYQKVPETPTDDVGPLECHTFEEAPLAASTRVGLVVSRFNEPVTRRLLAAAVATLRGASIAADAIDARQFQLEIQESGKGSVLQLTLSIY